MQQTLLGPLSELAVKRGSESKHRFGKHTTLRWTHPLTVGDVVLALDVDCGLAHFAFEASRDGS